MAAALLSQQRASRWRLQESCSTAPPCTACPPIALPLSLVCTLRLPPLIAPHRLLTDDITHHSELTHTLSPTSDVRSLSLTTARTSAASLLRHSAPCSAQVAHALSFPRSSAPEDAIMSFGFGSGNTGSTFGGFGSTNNNNTTNTSGGSLFGGNTSTAGGFGAAGAAGGFGGGNTSSPFGQSQNKTGFGSPAPATGGMFGNAGASTTGGFGGGATGGFGGANNTASTGFGASNTTGTSR